MKTQKEILAEIKNLEKSGTDPLGTSRSDLIDFLTFTHAKPFLTKGTTKAEWDRDKATFDHDFIVEKIKEYLPFAFTKAQQERGLSALRSLNHFYAWMFIIEDLENFDDLLVYENYGIDHLIAIAEFYGVDHTNF